MHKTFLEVARNDDGGIDKTKMSRPGFEPPISYMWVPRLDNCAISAYELRAQSVTAGFRWKMTMMITMMMMKKRKTYRKGNLELRSFIPKNIEESH